MQTFLPYPDFKRSAEVLDYKRLGKQRVECYQIFSILLALSNPTYYHVCSECSKILLIDSDCNCEEPIMQSLSYLIKNQEYKIPWQNHPAVRMWRGSVYTLIIYTREITKEWVRRGYKDNVGNKVTSLWKEHTKLLPNDELVKLCGGIPMWLGNRQFHDSHKSNLLRKDYEFYSAYGWDVPDNLPYYWPM